MAGVDGHYFNGESGPALETALRGPRDIAFGPDGALYIADEYNQRIRRLRPDGILESVAGGGTPDRYAGAFSGDGGPALAAELNNPTGVAVGPDGSIYIADKENHRIRKVGPDGIIRTIAGNGTAPSYGTTTYNTGCGREGIDAREACVQLPDTVAVGPDGTVYFSSYSRLLRRVRPTGQVDTLVNGHNTLSIPGYGSITIAQLRGVAVAPDGDVLMADWPYDRILRRGTKGEISVVAGVQPVLAAFSGDGGPGPAAALSGPLGVTVGPDGTVYIADTFNYRVRRVSQSAGAGSASILVPSSDASEVYAFSATGRHLSTRDVLTGATLYSFGYDAGGRLVSVTDRAGNATTIERDSAGTPTAIVSPYGERTTLVVDGAGNLERIIAPDGNDVALTTSPRGLLQTYEDERGGFTRFTYDAAGMLVFEELPDGGSRSLARTEFAGGRTVELTTEEGTHTSYRVERQAGSRTRRLITHADGTTTELFENPDGSRSLTSPDGTSRTWRLRPDPRFGMAAPLTQDVVETTPAGLTSTASETRAVTLANATDPLSLVSLAETTVVNGRTYRRDYTASTRRLLLRTPANRQTSLDLDAQGRLVTSRYDGINPVTMGYDARGRLSQATHGSGAGARTSGFAYDGAGRVSIVTDPIGTTHGFTYDAAGRVTDLALPDGNALTMGYDPHGNLTAVSPPGRDPHAFTHGATQLVTTYTAPTVGTVTSTTSYTYDADKRPTTWTRPDGALVMLAYAPGNDRLVSLTDPRGLTSLGYDTAGRLTSIAAPTGVTLAYGYDGSLLTSTTWSGELSGSVSFTYDTSHRLSTERINGANSITYTYDSDSLVTAAGALTISRAAATGFVTGTTLGTITTSESRNGFGELATTSAGLAATSLFTEAILTRDALGRIATKTETIEGTSKTYGYTYDARGRLVQVFENAALVREYTYDANGNRTSVYDGQLRTASFDAQDRLVADGTRAYTYGPAGELRTKADGTDTTSYTHDVFGSLTAATLPDATCIEYVTDGQHRRVAKKRNGVREQAFVYRDQLEPVAELDGTGAIVARFVYATRQHVPDYLVKAGVNYRIVTDHLSSVRLVVNATTGAIAQRLDYDEWGNVTLDTNPGFQPFGFAGGLYDRDTGLVRFGARDYDPQTGRWTAKDPILFGGGSTNLYSYVGNDPANRTDPTGLYILTHTDVDADAVEALLSTPLGVVLDTYAQSDDLHITVNQPGTRPAFDMAEAGGGQYWCQGAYCMIHVDPAMVGGDYAAALAHELGHSDTWFSGGDPWSEDNARLWEAIARGSVCQ